MFLNVLFLLVFVSSRALSRVVTEDYTPCGLTEFSCGDGTCISLNSFCNGNPDCLNSSDEASCVSGLGSSSLRVKKQVGQAICALDEWQCQDGTCVGAEDRCNGAINCPDGSDETRAACWDYVCEPSQFRCHYGGCVSGSAPCDGVVECADSSDELMARCFNQTFLEDEVYVDEDAALSRTKRQASTDCRRNQFRCRDGTCISSYDKCDGVKQCPDGSDETFALCRKNKCQSNWFRCMYGACVDGTAPCNNIQECADNSDELLPRCRNENEEVRGSFKCDSGQTIAAYSHCDGVRDCADGSDETLKTCSGKTCASYLFQCAYGACVDQGSDCDNKLDCADGSDEFDDLCNRTSTSVNTPPTFTPPTTGGACKLPPYPRHGSYVVLNKPNALPGQSFNSVNLNITCNPPYGVIGGDWRICNGGDWFPSNFNINSCVLFCRLPKDQSATYQCRLTGDSIGYRKCNEYEPPNTVLLPTCKNNYYSTDDTLDDMFCIGGSWSKPVPCKPECGTLVPSAKELVAGGRDAELGEISWHAAIYSKMFKPYKQICGGTLINSKIVLSAAHCFWHKVLKHKLPASNYAVALGKVHRPWDVESENEIAQKSDVQDIIVPEQYQDYLGNYQADIAIMLLKETIVYTTNIRPICLDFQENLERLQLSEGNKGTVAGWGLTGPVDKASQYLKVVELPYISYTKCKTESPLNFREFLSVDKICAGYNNGTAALCQGDSGGGLVFPSLERENIIRFYLRGIVSASPSPEESISCNVNWYTAFTAVSKHASLIKQYLRST